MISSKLSHPIYYFIENRLLIENSAHLFQSLWYEFPMNIGINRTLHNLFTFDQIDYVAKSDIFYLLSNSLQLAIEDYYRDD